MIISTLPWTTIKIPSDNLFNKILYTAQTTHDKKQRNKYIIYFEILAVVAMAALYGHTWRNSYITFYCDNPTAVRAVDKGVVKLNSQLYYPKANLVKLLASLSIKYQFKYQCLPIIGDNNKEADALSRSNDLKRNMVYHKVNKNHIIPSKLISKILKITCVGKFCPYIKLN